VAPQTSIVMVKPPSPPPSSSTPSLRNGHQIKNNVNRSKRQQGEAPAKHIDSNLDSIEENLRATDPTYAIRVSNDGDLLANTDNNDSDLWGTPNQHYYVNNGNGSLPPPSPDFPFVTVENGFYTVPISERYALLANLNFFSNSGNSGADREVNPRFEIVKLTYDPSDPLQSLDFEPLLSSSVNSHGTEPYGDSNHVVITGDVFLKQGDVITIQYRANLPDNSSNKPEFSFYGFGTTTDIVDSDDPRNLAFSSWSIKLEWIENLQNQIATLKKMLPDNSV
jgi:hypothetical protein